MPYLPLKEKPYGLANISSNGGQTLAEFIDMAKDDSGANTQRAGLLAFCDLGTSSGIDGSHENTKHSLSYHWADGRMFSVSFAGVATEIPGALMIPGRRVTVADFGDDIYFASGGTIGKYTVGDASATVVADTDAPTTVTHLAAIDGYLHALSGGVQYYSNPAQPDVWTALDFVTAETRPDITNCIYAGFQEVFAGGSETVEYFYNTGDANAPWQRINGAVTQRGVFAPNSVQQVDNTWFFLDQDRKVIRLNGRDPQVISTEVIEAEIRSYGAPSQAIGLHLPIETTYVLSFLYDGVTWAYDYKRSTWSKWSLWDNNVAIRSAWLGTSACYMRAWGKQLVGSRLTGKVYVCSQDYVTDGAYPLYWDMQTGAVDYGNPGGRKRCFGLALRHKRGVAGLGTNATIDLSYRNDGDTSWTTPRAIVLGENGDTIYTTREFSLGMYRQRQWRISGAAAVKVNIVDAEEIVG